MIAFIEPSWADVAPESHEHRAALLVAVSEQPAGLRPLRWTARDVVAVAVTLLDEDLDRLRIVAEPEAVRDALDAMALDPAVPSFRRDAVLRHRDAVQAAVLHAPTRQGIRDALAAFARDDFADTRRQRAVAVVYLSGHGTVNLPPPGTGDPWQGPVRYFVTADTAVGDVPGTGLPVAEVAGALKQVRASRRLLLNASCQSAAPGAKGAAAVESLVESEIAAGAGVSYEDDEHRHDLYTWHFLAALTDQSSDADGNGDGAVSDREAHEYALDGVAGWNTRLAGGLEPQVPGMDQHRIGPDELILAGRRGAAARGRVYARRRGSERMIFEARARGSAKSVDSQTLERSVRDLEGGCWEVRVREPEGRLRYQGPVCVRDRSIPVERLIDRTEVTTLSAGFGAYVPLDPALGDQLVGRGLALRVAGSFPLSDTPPVGWVADVQAFGLGGTGSQSLYDGPYATTWTGGAALVALRRLQRLPMGDLSLGAGMGGLAGVHTADGGPEVVGMRDFFLVAPAGSATLRYEATPGWRWTLGAGADLLVLAPSLDGDVAPRAILVGTVSVGRRW